MDCVSKRRPGGEDRASPPLPPMGPLMHEFVIRANLLILTCSIALLLNRNRRLRFFAPRPQGCFVLFRFLSAAGTAQRRERLVSRPVMVGNTADSPWQPLPALGSPCHPWQPVPALSRPWQLCQPSVATANPWQPLPALGNPWMGDAWGKGGECFNRKARHDCNLQRARLQFAKKALQFA